MSDIVKESSDYVRKTLKATKRAGIEDLLEHMEEIGFFTAACSGGNHLCCDHGLVVHTANVMKLADKLGKVLLGPEKFKEMRNSIRISAGLHDLGKCGQFGKKYYVENMVKDGRPTKAEPEQKYKRSDSKPFMQNKDLLHVDHPIRSVIEATLYIELTEEEQFAILYHDGLYGSLAYELKGKERPLQTLLHFADYWSAQFEEGKDIPLPDPLPEVTENDDDDLPFC